MNTVLKRKLSSVIAGESIVKNIGQGKYKNFCNTTSRNKNIDNKKKDTKQATKQDTKQKKHKYHNEDCIESAYKKQKKTHYNEKMEPIRVSSTSTSTGCGSAKFKLGIDTNYFPKRIREVVWNTYNGETYSSKCYVSWCNNIINVFNYQVGHDIPESKGGTYDIGNLRPICSNCNLSMGNKWTIQEWSKLVNHRQHPGKEQTGKEQTGKEQNNKTDLQVINNCNPETTSRITFITFVIPNI